MANDKRPAKPTIVSPALVGLSARDARAEDALIDSVYQAALVPELWPTVLGNLSATVDGVGGLLFTSHLDRIRWTGSPDIYDLFVEFLRDGWAAINPRPLRMASFNHPGFIRDYDCFTPEELDADPVYVFLRQHGLGWATGTMIDVPSGDSIIFSFERAYDKGPILPETVQFFDRLRPHLARAALMASRLGLERAQTMAAALELLGLPGAVLATGGRLIAANPSFEALMPGVAQDRRDRLHLIDAGADGLFGEAVRSASSGVTVATVNSIPIAAREGRAPLIAHVVPVRGMAHDVFSRAASLMVITPVDHGAVPGARVLQGLFDFTPAEARVAAAIGEGQTVEAIAAAGGVSRETVRSHLKAVLAKVGVSRQVDLVRLLAGTTLPR